METKFTHTILARAIQTMLLGLMTTTANHAAPIQEPINHTARYLDPSIWNITVTQDECFSAAPQSLLQVEPLMQNGARVYKVSQFFDETLQKKLYAQTVDEQIKNRKIIGKEFCHGIVSLSNMDIPLVKDKDNLDANDGVLFINAIRHKMSEMQNNLNQMHNIATQAASGTCDSEQLLSLDRTFQAHLNSIEQIAKTARFQDISLFDSHTLSLNVAKLIEIPLFNLTTGSIGLNIADLHVDSNLGALTALDTLDNTMSIYSDFSQLNATNIQLDALAKRTTQITQVDVTTDDFVVQHQTSLLPNSQKSHS